MTEQESTEPEESGTIVPAGTTVPDTEVSTIVDTTEEEAEPETFPLDYVQKLRQEAADARVKAKRTDDLAARLHTALVAATGRLADPTDMPFDEAHLDNQESLNSALDALLLAKPHLANRKPRGNVGQGESGGSGTFDLAGLLRQRAG